MIRQSPTALGYLVIAKPSKAAYLCCSLSHYYLREPRVFVFSHDSFSNILLDSSWIRRLRLYCPVSLPCHQRRRVQLSESSPLHEMLQPFKVRDLASQTANANLHAVASAERTSQDTAAKYTEIGTTHDVRRDERHGVVVLSASEYDHIISTHPRAALMYMDPDDGETITVSTTD